MSNSAARTAATMTHLQYSEHLRKLKNRAEAVSAQRRRRFARMCSEAGVEPSALHNALVGAHQGRSWPGFDYDAARRAQAFEARIFDAERIVSRYYDRTWREIGTRLAA